MDSLRNGVFVKTPSPHIIEILAHSGLDFVIADIEHAPLDIATLDLFALAAQSTQLDLLARVPNIEASTLSRVLDLGFSGVFLPHIETAEQAKRAVSLCRYQTGARGYSSAPRSSGYGTLGTKEIIKKSQTLQIVCQIESPQGIENAYAIAATEGVQAVFIGRADLALSMGHSNSSDPDVLAATSQAIQAVLAANKPVAIMVGTANAQATYQKKGVRIFIHGSDQSLLLRAAKKVVHQNTRCHNG